MTSIPSLDQLRKAVRIAEQIESMKAELAALLGEEAAATSSKGAKRGPKPKKGKRTMSPEGRAKIAEAQKKRWAKAKES